MQFLNTDKSKWIVKGIEIPVIENVPIPELMWFRQRLKEIDKIKESGSVPDGIRFDEEWWDKVCKLGLGMETRDVQAIKGLNFNEFRELMAEVYSFLTVFCSVEGAKLSGYYDQKIQ